MGGCQLAERAKSHVGPELATPLASVPLSPSTMITSALAMSTVPRVPFPSHPSVLVLSTSLPFLHPHLLFPPMLTAQRTPFRLRRTL